MGSKPFMTIDDQVQRLRDRGLTIESPEKAKKILLRENYYNVINGYKMPFLKRNLDGTLSDPEQFTEGCSFDEVYSLHNIDRELRILILKYLLQFETHFKTLCAYHFSNKFREPYSYLNIGNYSNDKKALSTVLRNIAGLSAEVNRNTNTNRPKSPYIGHYISNHDSVPLWVLVNSLTIGNMSYFYDSIDQNLKYTIAYDFSKQYKTNYISREKIESGEMSKLVQAVNLFRNVCAHEEVLYLFKLNKNLKPSIFKKFFKGDGIGSSEIEQSDLFAFIALIKLILPKEEYLELISGIQEIFDKYRANFTSIPFEKIIILSGFKPSWKSDIESNL